MPAWARQLVTGWRRGAWAGCGAGGRQALGKESATYRGEQHGGGIGKLGTGVGQGFAPLFGATLPPGVTHHPEISLLTGILPPTVLTAEMFTLGSDQQGDS